MKLLEHGMKLVGNVLENRLCRIVTVDEMQFGFMPDSGTIHAVFIIICLQEEHHTKGKMYMFCGLGECF